MPQTLEQYKLQLDLTENLIKLRVSKTGSSANDLKSRYMFYVPLEFRVTSGWKITRNWNSIALAFSKIDQTVVCSSVASNIFLVALAVCSWKAKIKTPGKGRYGKKTKRMKISYTVKNYCLVFHSLMSAFKHWLVLWAGIKASVSVM